MLLTTHPVDGQIFTFGEFCISHRASHRLRFTFKALVPSGLVAQDAIFLSASHARFDCGLIVDQGQCRDGHKVLEPSTRADITALYPGGEVKPDKQEDPGHRSRVLQGCQDTTSASEARDSRTRP